MARSYPGQPANPPYPPPPAPEVNPAGPPPAPSSRQVHAGYVEPLPSFENTPIDMVAETVEAIPDEEPNPFQKPGRFDRFRKLLKKPSREMSIRAGFAAAALLVGWGVGAKPWKSDPPRAAMSAKASSAAKSAAAAKANKPAARPAAAPAAAKAEAPRRVAVVAHDSPPVLAKPRAESKAAVAPKAKVTTKSAPAKAAATKAVKAKAKAANKVSAKKASKAATAKASLKAKAKAKAKPKATAKKAAAKHG